MHTHTIIMNLQAAANAVLKTKGMLGRGSDRLAETLMLTTSRRFARVSDGDETHGYIDTVHDTRTGAYQIIVYCYESSDLPALHAQNPNVRSLPCNAAAIDGVLYLHKPV